MKFKKHMKNAMLKNSNTHWVMETEITIPLSLKKSRYTYSNFVRNHVKLEIRSFVMNFNSGVFSLRILYCVVDTGYGLGGSLGDCRPALS